MRCWFSSGATSPSSHSRRRLWRKRTRLRRQLAEHLRGIIEQLAPEDANAGVPVERIPDAVISRLAEKHQSKMAWLVADIRQVQRLLDEGKPLVEHDFAALDEVCDAADATASASFRRLWRR